jgi:membrane protein DedA with SNARE-associated domain
MITWLTQFESFVGQFGLPGLFADVYLEAMGLPVPGETLLIISSSLAGLGKLNIYAVAATAFSAAVLGDNTGYFIGRKLGRPLVVRYGKRLGITPRRLDRVERIVQKRGPFIVALARFFILLRQLNGIAAGTVGMHWLTFLVANAIGAALWVGLWTVLAYQFGANIHLLPYIWRHFSVAAMLIVLLILALLAMGWWYGRRSRVAGTSRDE